MSDSTDEPKNKTTANNSDLITVNVNVDEIFVPSGRRPVNAAKVAEFADSIARVGLEQPIGVTEEGGRFRLVFGAHRLAAARALGWTDIAAVIVRGDDVRIRLAEIAENLHRVELTALERDEHIAEWIKLTEGVPSQVETKSRQGGRRKGKAKVSRQVDEKPQGGRPEGGVSAASRALGLSEPDARRAVKVAGLSPEAKTAATEVGLDGNRSALLAAAKESDPAKQVEALRAWQARPTSSPPPTGEIFQSRPPSALLEIANLKQRTQTLEAENVALRAELAARQAQLEAVQPPRRPELWSISTPERGAKATNSEWTHALELLKPERLLRVASEKFLLELKALLAVAPKVEKRSLPALVATISVLPDKDITALWNAIGRERSLRTVPAHWHIAAADDGLDIPTELRRERLN